MKRLFEILKLVPSHSLRLFILDVLQQFKLSIYPSFRALCQKEFDWSIREYPWQGLFTGRNVLEWKLFKSNSLDIYSEIERLNFPFKLFPNVSKFEVQIGPLDWLYALFGFAVRTNISKAMIRNHINGKVNRALFQKYYELYLLVEAKEFDLYWTAALRLLRNREYQLVSLNYVLPDWYRMLSCKKVDSIVRKVKNLCENLESDIKFKRVYIDKINGKKRPLGVPSYEWRIYLHMINNLIVLSRRNNQGSQHGYFPGRGCHTAWEEIIKNLSKYKYVYEFDLKGFFDNVDLNVIQKVLKEKYFMNDKFLKLIFEINRSIVELMPVDLLPEPDRVPLLSGQNKINKNYAKSRSTLVPFLNYYEDLGLTKDWILDQKDYDFLIYRKYGVPQGASTSCSLSTLAIEHVTDKLNNEDLGITVMYADDGIMFSNTEEYVQSTIDELSKSGSSVSLEKSKWLKKNGEYLGTLKFCGLKYNPISEILSAETRKGSKLNFGSREKFLNFLLEYRNTLKVNSSGGKLVENPINNMSDFLIGGLSLYLKTPSLNLFSTSSVGWFMSKLYNGSYNNYTKKGSPLSYFRGSFIDKHLYSYIFKRSRESCLLLKVLFFEAEWRMVKLLTSLSVSEVLKKELNYSFSSCIDKVKFRYRSRQIVYEKDEFSLIFEDLSKFFRDCHINLSNKELILCEELSQIFLILNAYRLSQFLFPNFYLFLSHFRFNKEVSQSLIHSFLNYHLDSIVNVSSFACDYLLKNESVEQKSLIKYYARHPWKKLRPLEKVSSGGLILGLSKRMKKELSNIWKTYK